MRLFVLCRDSAAANNAGVSPTTNTSDVLHVVYLLTWPQISQYDQTRRAAGAIADNSTASYGFQDAL